MTGSRPPSSPSSTPEEKKLGAGEGPTFFAANALPTLDSLSALIKDEEIVLDIIFNALITNNPTDLNQIAQVIQSYGMDTLFKFSNQTRFDEESKQAVLSKKSVAFIKFCEEDSLLQETWQELLAKIKYPTFSIVDIHGRKQSSVYKQLLSAFLFTQFKRYEALASSGEDKSSATIPDHGIMLLDKACSLGNFYAVTKRHQLNLDKFRHSSLSAEEQKSLVDECMSLGEIFWSAGYIQAGGMFNAIAKDFTKSGEMPLAEIFYRAALDALCLAAELAHEKPSQDLLAILNHEDGTKIILDDQNQFATYAEACHSILKLSGLTVSDYNMARQNAERKHVLFPKKKEHPVKKSKP